MTPQREKAEELIYNTMDALDPSGMNSSYYKQKFAEMSDAQFEKFISNDLALKFQTRPFEIEPKMTNIEKAAKVIGVPLLEKVSLPYLYKDSKGNPVKSKECLVIYQHIKKMKQFITKKNAMSTDISKRDMKTGLLIADDKNGKTSDREFESLAVLGLDQTARELSRPRADAMNAKSVMYNTLNIMGQVDLDELPRDVDDVLSRNLLDAYFIGSQLKTNLITDDYHLPITLKDRKRATEREIDKK